MDPMTDRERLISVIERYGEIPRRGRELPMSATIYDEEEDPHFRNSIWSWDYLEDDENGDY